MLLLAWAIGMIFGLFIFIFLHECGHGFGYQLEGVHVSTSFNLVGASGKRPNDPDFTIDFPISGKLDSGALLGPFTNWMLAILFTALLWNSTQANWLTFILALAAITNAFMRFMPMTFFFIVALFKRVSYQDELLWSLHTIKDLELPISFEDYFQLIQTEPTRFLSQPRFFFWPVVSWLITTPCIVLAYLKFFQLFGPQINGPILAIIYILMPVIVFVPTLFLINKLDNLVRINW